MKKIILWLLSALCALFMGVVALPNAIPLQTASADNTSASTADDLGTLWSSIMVSDNLTSSIQGQWYKINIPYQGELTIDFSHDTMASSSTYWNIYLYQSNASTNWADASGSSWNIYGDANRTIENIYLTAGTYYIKIDNGSKYSSSTYEMTLSFTQNAYCESECNSSHEQADPIQLNASYAATIINSNDVDWFTFTTYYAGYITIDFLHESLGSTSKYWNLYLYQADAATRFNGESASWSFTGNETNSATSKIGLPAGTYYIKITDSSKQSAIPYNLCVNFTKTNYFEKENNGDFTLATPMQVNQTYTGVISFSSDVDWYQFTTTQTGHFNVSFTHDSNGSTSRYWKILLLGSDGATYITDITHQWNIIGSSNMHTAEYGIPADTYYIKVTDNTYNTDIPYNITVNFTPSDDWEQENNHTYSTANDMQTKKTWNGAITSGSDKDWFKIQTTYTANYTVKLTHTAIDVSDVWWIYVYQNDGATTIKSLKVKSNSTANSLTLENLSSGTYYVRVSGDSNSDASYTVSITDDHTHSYSSSGTNYSSSQHYKTCSLCKEKALFSHTWNSGTVLKSPTHLETGVRKYTCTECQATKESSIPQTAAHEYGDWEQFSATQHVHTCICGEKEYVDHNWNSGLVTTPPTCTENGVKEYVCQSCSLEKTETLAPEHKPVTVPAKKPTCTEDGYNAYSYCGVCNEEIVEMVAVPATGHT
ncbi:MAG: hypothetical protein IJX75_04745, partial [Clostridia bacterium]|nr:hypothetical protein [Clostridia bacterium]